MKKLLAICLLSLIVINAYCQQKPKMSFKVAKELASSENTNKNIALLVKGDVQRIKELVLQEGGIFKFSKGDIASVSMPVHGINAFINDNNISRIEEGALKLKPLMDDTMRYMNNIIQVYNGDLPLTQAYTGKNVVLGIIDGGFDFTHPDFKDNLGKTRVKYLWDHILPNAANTPMPYNYGQEFTGADIDNNLAGAHLSAHQATSFLSTNMAHGTCISGIAAGNGKAVGEYIGAAPEADLIVASLDFNLNDDLFLSSIVDAVDYIYSKADAMGKPCIINISAGTYFGSHDGKDLSTQLIDFMITEKSRRSLVCAAGNAGNFPLHVQTTNSGDTLFTWLNQSLPWAEVWGDSSSMNHLDFTIAADKTSGGYEYRGALPYMNIQQQIGVLQQDTIYSIDGNRLAIVVSYGDIFDDQCMMYYEIHADSLYNWRIQSKGTGTYDSYSYYWVPAASIPTSAVFPPIGKYVIPDYKQNMCSSFQCSDKTVTVGNYINMNQYHCYTNALVTFPTTIGALGATSSKGPTRNGRIKPDITAASDWTFGALLVSSQPWFAAHDTIKIPPTGQHIRGDKTSTASAIVSGIVALYFEKYPYASWQDVKNALLNCSSTDLFTGSSLPDNDWGYGKVNAFNMLTNCGITAVSKVTHGNQFLSCSPNPSSGSVELKFPEMTSPGQLIITDVQGRIAEELQIPSGVDHYELIRGKKLLTGMYFLKIVSAKQTMTTGKLIYQ